MRRNLSVTFDEVIDDDDDSLSRSSTRERRDAPSMKRAMSVPGRLDDAAEASSGWAYGETSFGKLQSRDSSWTDISAVPGALPAAPAPARRSRPGHRRVASENNLSSLAAAARSAPDGASRWENMLRFWDALPRENSGVVAAEC